MKPLPTLSASNRETKQVWQAPAIVLEYALVAKAQGPFEGSLEERKEDDPFLGAFSASGV